MKSESQIRCALREWVVQASGQVAAEDVDIPSGPREVGEIAQHPVLHEPHEPPHPSGPHTSPVHEGVHVAAARAVLVQPDPEMTPARGVEQREGEPGLEHLVRDFDRVGG